LRFTNCDLRIKKSKSKMFLNHFIRMCNPSFYCCCSSNCRVGKVYLTFGMPHPADKISVGCGKGPLSLCQNSHMPAKAWATGRRADYCPRLEVNLEQPFFHRLFLDKRSCRYYNQPYIVCDLFALQYLCSNP